MRIRVFLATALTAGIIAFSAHALRAQASRSVWEGVYSVEQEKRGAGLHAQYCASCHAENLAGNDEAPPLAGGEFLSNWSGLTVGDLFERIRTTMPFNQPQSPSRDVNAAILAHILSVNKFPAGNTDLSTQTEVLKEIRIDPKPDQGQ